jgi:predicted transcriptional regulator
MPGQRGSERRRLTQAVTIRMDDDLAARCANAALAVHLSRAGWLRRLAANAVWLEGEEARRSKPRATLKQRPDDLTRVLVAVADRLVALAAVLAEISLIQSSGDDDVILSDLQPAMALTRSISADVIAAIEMAAPQ